MVGWPLRAKGQLDRQLLPAIAHKVWLKSLGPLSMGTHFLLCPQAPESQCSEKGKAHALSTTTLISNDVNMNKIKMKKKKTKTKTFDRLAS